MRVIGTPPGALSLDDNDDAAPATRSIPPAHEDQLEAVKAIMLQLAAGRRFERLGAIVQEHLFTGGKRLRARLAIESLQALGGPDEAAPAWGAACELLHNATLVHDDLQDSDPMRRGHFTVWMRHGHAQAINAGDLLLMLPFIAVEQVQASDATRWHLARAIARRAEETVRGQSLEMCLLSGAQWDWDSYAAAASGKTSALMALPVHGSALLAGRSCEESERLAEPFLDLGLLFQIQDDIVDLFGDKGRGERGGDLREGRVSALVVEHLRLRPNDSNWLVGILRKPREETTAQDIDQAARAFERAGALAAVLEKLKGLQQSIETSEALASEARLRRVAQKLIQLSLQPVRGLLETNS
ncbi:MAG: polyprenyl synthetase family protein [Myxococcota bacterium]